MTKMISVFDFPDPVALTDAEINAVSGGLGGISSDVGVPGAVDGPLMEGKKKGSSVSTYLTVTMTEILIST
jgi:hypothetical protein